VTILDEILERKRGEVAAARQAVSDAELARRAAEFSEAPRGFRSAVASGSRPRIIAEIKSRSPSKGEIRPGFEPVDCARAYSEGGASALSVLTDEHYFGGHLDMLEKVRRAVELPVLRKDFIIDPYQVQEARVRGADALLLIVAAFPGAAGADTLQALRSAAIGLGLDVLVEVHDEAQLEVAIGIGADLVGINNRDLRSFEVDLGTTERLAGRVPEGVVLVAASGIFTPQHVERLERAGAHAFLVGESLMREPDLAGALRRLRRAS
jgi:indole-3-glycerol phosphate synthase